MYIAKAWLIFAQMKLLQQLICLSKPVHERYTIFACACKFYLHYVRLQVCRDVMAGMEVLVWYGDRYLQFMGIPVTLKISSEETDIINKAEDNSR